MNVIGCLSAEHWQNVQTWHSNMRVVRALMDHCDFDAQQIPHRRFWGHSCHWGTNGDLLAVINGSWYFGHIDWFADMKKLTNYLSMCFDMLVRYDCVMKEAGVEIDWVQLIIEWTPLPFNKKLVCTQPETSLYKLNFI